MERTARERIADRLREETLTATAIASEFSLSTADALDHIEHVAKSLAARDEEVFVAPPECQDCGFGAFSSILRNLVASSLHPRRDA